MKIETIKTSVGLIPANDRESEKFKRFLDRALYTIDIKEPRNPKFHRKVFAFLNYCFEYWQNDNDYQTERTSFDVFRDNLTVIAGFKDVYYKLDGSLRVEAKSISYASMEQDDFEQYYLALIQAAMSTIFKDCDESYYNQLLAFF